MSRVADRKSRKSQGVHYTPAKLAAFLARRLWINAASDFSNADKPIRILDPACGDGALLGAIADQISNRQLAITGFETDSSAVQKAKENLSPFSNCQTQILNEDFLEYAIEQQDTQFDIVITNPPYVRTQVLGQQKSQKLADEFGLQGRVDLYHAFLAAITKLVNESGWIATLTSNRFMYVQSGKTTRQLFREQYDIAELYDLGDTKLFEASVLPAVLIARKSVARRDRTKFIRVQMGDMNETQNDSATLFDHIEQATDRSFNMKDDANREYEVETGWLEVDKTRQLWRLASHQGQTWLNKVAAGQFMTIDEVAEVKVGIKTTADSVFIRDDWEQLPDDQQPETSLLQPLLTHKVARRWIGAQPKKRVLYPYELQKNRTPIDLHRFAKARAYFDTNREQLSRRKYLIDAGRKWFEIWVPHVATDWQIPKIVWPEISETPKFFLDCSGAVVNGDCYWIKLKPGHNQDLLYLILAVANSNLAVQFYDYCFHNLLYGGRRRFMTQYVKQFPLPNPDSANGQACIVAVKRLLAADPSEQMKIEASIGILVDQAFGLRTSADASINCP